MLRGWSLHLWAAGPVPSGTPRPAQSVPAETWLCTLLRLTSEAAFLRSCYASSCETSEMPSSSAW